jgi:hypothetical protein
MPPILYLGVLLIRIIKLVLMASYLFQYKGTGEGR